MNDSCRKSLKQANQVEKVSLDLEKPGPVAPFLSGLLLCCPPTKWTPVSLRCLADLTSGRAINCEVHEGRGRRNEFIAPWWFFSLEVFQGWDFDRTSGSPPPSAHTTCPPPHHLLYPPSAAFPCQSILNLTLWAPPSPTPVPTLHLCPLQRATRCRLLPAKNHVSLLLSSFLSSPRRVSSLTSCRGKVEPRKIVITALILEGLLLIQQRERRNFELQM